MYEIIDELKQIIKDYNLGEELEISATFIVNYFLERGITPHFSIITLSDNTIALEIIVKEINERFNILTNGAIFQLRY